jgi:hypothetical protein
VAYTNRENRVINAAIHERLKEEGLVSQDSRQIQVRQRLGWTLAERREVKNLKPGMVLEETMGEYKGRAWEVKKVSEDGKKAYAIDKTGSVEFIAAAANAHHWNVCEKAVITASPGDKLITNAGMKMGKYRIGKVYKTREVIDGYEFELVGFAPDGALIATDGTRVTTRNLSLAYSVTSHKSESGTWDTGVVSFDENSIRFADRPFSYVSGTRFGQKMTVVVPDKHALAAIQNRSGERKSATSLIEQVIDRIKRGISQTMGYKHTRTCGERRFADRDRQRGDVLESARRRDVGALDLRRL